MLITIEQAPIILPQYPRTKGIHLSNVIRCIAQETGILRLELIEDLSLISEYREITDRVALLRISIGLAWEMFYIPNMIPGCIDHPAEMLRDGIYMNKDGETTAFIHLIRSLLVHEVKATYKSTRTVGLTEEEFIKNRKKNWMWLSQLMSYCLASETLQGWLHVLFLNNNYKWPMIPEALIYKFNFEQSELDENWQLITDYRDERLSLDQLRDAEVASQRRIYVSRGRETEERDSNLSGRSNQLRQDRVHDVVPSNRRYTRRRPQS